MTSSYFNFDGINESTLPSWEDSFNYEPSDSITGSGAGSPKWKEAVLTASKYLSQPKEKDGNKYRKQQEFKNSLQASISKGPDDTTIYTPPTQAPVYLPREQDQGFGGPLGSVVGALAGGLIGGPAGVGPGAQIGGSIGGAFG